VPFLALGIVILVLANRCLSCEYIEGFEKIKGVLSVGKFSQYEDHLSAEILLNNGGFLDVGEFGKDIFTKAEYLILFRIGDIGIKCLNENGNWTGGFDIIHFANNYMSIGNIESIKDVVENYDNIYKKLDKFLKDSPSESEPLIFLPKNKEFEARKLWCYRKA